LVVHAMFWIQESKQILKAYFAQLENPSKGRNI
jgi:hypothetical protein